jgi:hypothetical protein
MKCYPADHNQIIMPFGRHFGQSLGSVPTSYLAWLNRQTWTYGELKAAVRAVLLRRYSVPSEPNHVDERRDVWG